VVSFFWMRLDTSYRDMVRPERSSERQGQPPYRMGRRAGRGGNPVDFLKSICPPEFREIFFLRNPEELEGVLPFLNARLNSGRYFPCKILHRFISFVDFFECRRGKVYGGRERQPPR